MATRELSHIETDFLIDIPPKIKILKSVVSLMIQHIVTVLCKSCIVSVVKVFRINPEIRILRLTFHRKSASKC